MEWVPELKGQPTPPRQRRLTPLQHQLLIEQTEAWLKQGVVEKCNGIIWVNNPVFVAKKNGQVRTCIDCSPANAVTKDFDWPLPRLQDLRHRLSGARWFARIDLRNAFFRIRVPAKWRHLTAYECDGIRYQFKRMPFGLKTAPAVFQRYMDHVMAPHFLYAFWYIDDVLIYADSLPDLRKRTRAVKQRLMETGNEINEDKSEYEQPALLMAGMWIFTNGMGPNFEKLRQLHSLPPPRNKPELRSALGLVSYLREFIPLVSLLTARLSGAEVDPEELHREWGRLMKHIGKAITTIRHFDDTRPADLYTDASLQALGAVLIQDGKLIACASRKLTQAETRYSATDREHLSLAFAAGKFKLFLHRAYAQTAVWNDHKALLGRKDDQMTPRQARTKEKIDTWIPRLKHVKGEENPADFFSRWSLGTVWGQIRV